MEEGSGVSAESGETEEGDAAQDLVWALFLEMAPPGANSCFVQRVLDWCIRRFQPHPCMAHVELCISSESGDAPSGNFGIYIGEKAGWCETEYFYRSYYLLPEKTWRAVPIANPGAARRVQEEIDRHHSSTSYSVASYLLSVPPLRSLAFLRNDSPGTSAHCATLVARVLRGALSASGFVLPNPSAWYGPSTLYLELSRRERMESMRESMRREMDDERAGMSADATSARQREEECADALPSASDAAIRSSDWKMRQRCKVRYSRRVVDACLAGDPTKLRHAEITLARVLLRDAASRFENVDADATGAV